MTYGNISLYNVYCIYIYILPGFLLAGSSNTLIHLRRVHLSGRRRDVPWGSDKDTHQGLKMIPIEKYIWSCI